MVAAAAAAAAVHVDGVVRTWPRHSGGTRTPLTWQRTCPSVHASAALHSEDAKAIGSSAASSPLAPSTTLVDSDTGELHGNHGGIGELRGNRAPVHHAHVTCLHWEVVRADFPHASPALGPSR